MADEKPPRSVPVEVMKESPSDSSPFRTALYAACASERQGPQKHCDR